MTSIEWRHMMKSVVKQRTIMIFVRWHVVCLHDTLIRRFRCNRTKHYQMAEATLNYQTIRTSHAAREAV
jgi:hypothetical protein